MFDGKAGFEVKRHGKAATGATDSYSAAMAVNITVISLSSLLIACRKLRLALNPCGLQGPAGELLKTWNAGANEEVTFRGAGFGKYAMCFHNTGTKPGEAAFIYEYMTVRTMPPICMPRVFIRNLI